MVWIIATVSLVLYAPLAEYIAHRWVMHYPGLGRGTLWRDHAVEHHGRGRNDLNIEMSALSVLPAATPLLAFGVVLGWAWVAFVLLACIVYAAVWSSLHASYHGVSDCWATSLRVYRVWQQHHMLHHEYPRMNFGTVFIFTDVVFRTRYYR